MKLAPFFTALTAISTSFAAVGCSSDGESGDSGGPVAAAPLKGSIAGQDWVAKMAIASPGFSDEPGTKSVTIYDADVDCKTAGSAGSDRKILFSTEWKSGLSKDLKFSFGGGDGENQTITFVTSPGQNVISNTGRLEIVDAPTEAEQKGKLRLRATAKENSVEGEIDVLVCER